MASIKGTRTEKNLLAAFAGESQARNRYSYAASAARKEGYEQVAAIFLETAEQEKQHAKRFFRFLEGGMVEISAAYPAGTIASTVENLRAAAAGEHEEHTELYPKFARIAKEEGFPQAASQFTLTAKAEAHHEERYRMLLANLETGSVFRKSSNTKWICRECGYVHEGPEAPGKCPCCDHPQAFYQVLVDSY
ncbi:MAG: rubrerythrin [Chitinispirillaceae bacterium]|jgi:rubrerythrin